MEKFCVFCGKNPEEKNMEHVIPKWLIELTGDRNRKIRVGFDISKKNETMREYSFSAFKFPACKECNTSFSGIEGKARPIIIKMLNKEGISEIEISTLLNWIDKIRIGLWLGYHYLDKNIYGIRPNFHIASRVGTADRMLAIYSSMDNVNRINFMGVNLPLFQYIPCCFTLIINDLYFFNISTTFLISRRIGFPYPINSYLLDGDKIGKTFMEIGPGLRRYLLPLMRRPLLKPCTEIYQPMFSSPEYEMARKYYNNDYVRTKCIDWKNGIGKIFIQEDKKLSQYSIKESKVWQPTASFTREYLDHHIGLQTLEFQNYLTKIGPSLEKLSKETRKQMKADISFAKKVNNIVIEQGKKEPRNYIN